MFHAWRLLIIFPCKLFHLKTGYTIYPCGDGAITVSFGNTIDKTKNEWVHRLFNFLKQKRETHWLDIIPAYTSVTVVYDLRAVSNVHGSVTAYNSVKQRIEEGIQHMHETSQNQHRLLNIPVCYDLTFGLDIKTIISRQKISLEKFVTIHTQQSYSVFMLGFLPGFAYMGTVDKQIATPRLARPRNHVMAGSVGIAGEQTGIYSFDSPGGWNIIGRTPLKLFNAEHENPALFQPGDEVRFFSISKKEFDSFDHSYSPVQ